VPHTLPDNAALIIIDVQQGMDDPRRPPRNTPGAEEQMARLSALGCHEFQGHLTGLPISAAAIETTRLRARRIRRRA
jgi:nicotinamidase-related amidase